MYNRTSCVCICVSLCGEGERKENVVKFQHLETLDRVFENPLYFSFNFKSEVTPKLKVNKKIFKIPLFTTNIHVRRKKKISL